MHDPAQAIDDLATEMVHHLAERWVGRGLPLQPLADAMACWGLSAASVENGPEAVAAGLERIAAEVRQIVVGEAEPVVGHA